MTVVDTISHTCVLYQVYNYGKIYAEVLKNVIETNVIRRPSFYRNTRSSSQT